MARTTATERTTASMTDEKNRSLMESTIALREMKASLMMKVMASSMSLPSAKTCESGGKIHG
jgi:Zn-dependent oligopeptidase